MEAVLELILTVILLNLGLSTEIFLLLWIFLSFFFVNVSRGLILQVIDPWQA